MAAAIIRVVSDAFVVIPLDGRYAHVHNEFLDLIRLTCIAAKIAKAKDGVEAAAHDMSLNGLHGGQVGMKVREDGYSRAHLNSPL